MQCGLSEPSQFPHCVSFGMLQFHGRIEQAVMLRILIQKNSHLGLQ